LRRPLIVLLTLTATFGAALPTLGCGADEEAAKQKQQAVAAQAAKRERERKEAKAEAERREAALKADQVATACRDRFGDLLAELHQLDSRLSIGLNFTNYSERVGDARVAYDEAVEDAAQDDGLDCLTTVGLPMEKALNKYTSAYNIWNDCVSDLYCDNSSITGRLRTRWDGANEYIQSAEDALDELATPSEASTGTFDYTHD
jgi:hypothetical protein